MHDIVAAVAGAAVWIGADHLSVIRENGCVRAAAPYIRRYGPSASPLFPVVQRLVCIGFGVVADLASWTTAGRLRTTKILAKDFL
jgi:hypothetical protein